VHSRFCGSPPGFEEPLGQILDALLVLQTLQESRRQSALTMVRAVQAAGHGPECVRVPTERDYERDELLETLSR
jgi:hypothetical protein